MRSLSATENGNYSNYFKQYIKVKRKEILEDELNWFEGGYATVFQLAQQQKHVSEQLYTLSFYYYYYHYYFFKNKTTND